MENNNKTGTEGVEIGAAAITTAITTARDASSTANNAGVKNQLSTDQVQDVSRHFLHNHVNPLIAVEATALYDPTFNYHFAPFTRNIEAYCTVRKPKRFSVPQIVVSDGNKAYLVNMGNNHGPIQTTDLDDSDEGSLQTSYDSTTRSLLNQFDENESCFDDIDLSTTKDELTLTNSSSDDPLSFEDDFNPTVIEKEPPKIVHYCTLRHKPKEEVSPQEKIASAYATLRKKFSPNHKVVPLERFDTITSLDCVERVNDYLFELDTYLEEMDQSPPTTTSRESKRQRNNDFETPPAPPLQIDTGSSSYTTQLKTINSNNNEFVLNATTEINLAGNYRGEDRKSNTETINEENESKKPTQVIVEMVESDGDCGNVIVRGPMTTTNNQLQLPTIAIPSPPLVFKASTSQPTASSSSSSSTDTKPKTDNQHPYANGIVNGSSHINNSNHLFYTLPKRQLPTKKVNASDLVHCRDNGHATSSNNDHVDQNGVIIRRDQNLRQPKRSTSWAPVGTGGSQNDARKNGE